MFFFTNEFTMTLIVWIFFLLRVSLNAKLMSKIVKIKVVILQLWKNLLFCGYIKCADPIFSNGTRLYLYIYVCIPIPILIIPKCEMRLRTVSSSSTSSHSHSDFPLIQGYLCLSVDAHIHTRTYKYIYRVID